MTIFIDGDKFVIPNWIDPKMGQEFLTRSILGRQIEIESIGEVLGYRGNDPTY